MDNFKPTEYKLRCIATDRLFEDDGWLLEDKQCGTPSLVRTVYGKRQIDILDEKYGIYRFGDWLPLKRTLKGSAAPVTYKSTGLARKFDLENLYITLNGYCPERGAMMTTCSFKETEAYSVCGRMSDDMERILVVASAGNTARAFAKVCSENNIPLLLSVPEDNLESLWFDAPLNDCVKLIAVQKGADYFDAIHLSNVVLKSKRFIAEGGAKNVARRDGMGTTLLSAAHVMGCIPDYYFQAVGSGTGAIAAWEAALRLEADGRFGANNLRLMVSQNAPFVPMFDAWRAGSRHMLSYEDHRARRDAGIIDAKVLSNRRPPYGLAGGLFDVLTESKGDFFVSTNSALRKAARLFEECEGVDIHPAAAVAVDSLLQAVKFGKVDRNAKIMLNITGCGEQAYKKDKQIWSLKPSIVFTLNATDEEIISKTEALF